MFLYANIIFNEKQDNNINFIADIYLFKGS